MQTQYYLIFSTSENPVIRRIREGVFAEAAERRCARLVDFHSSRELPAQAWTGCAGAIIQVWTSAMAKRLRRMRFPIINVANSMGAIAGLGNILSDDRAVGRLAARHLLDLGFRRILVIGQAGRVFSRERRDGAVEETRAAGGDAESIEVSGELPNFRWSYSRYVEAIWEQLGAKIEALPPRSAIFGVNDWVAWPVLRLIEDRLPDRAAAIGVVGADDAHETIYDPRLTSGLSSVRPGFRQIGRAALAALMEHDNDRAAVARISQRIPPEGVAVRASSAGPACDDPLTMRMARLFWASLREGALIPVEEMARRHGMTRRTLERKFGEHYGRTAREYIAGLRMELARELLQETDLTMGEIAERCGFADAPSFSSAFRKHAGCAPREFRAAKKARS